MPQKPIANGFFLLGLPLGLLASTARAEPSPEERFVRRVCAHAIVAEAIAAEVSMGDAAVTAADVLPNPSLILQHQQTLDGAADRETIVGLGVPLGLGGRRFKRQEAAEVRRLAGRARGDAAAADLAIAAQQGWTRAAIARARLELRAEHQAHLAALGAIIAGLARGGEAAKHDSDRQRVKAALHRAELAEAEAGVAATQAELIAWGSAGDAPSLGDASLLGSAPWPTAPAASPRLEALAYAAKADAVEAEAARRAWVPDVDLFGGYRNVEAGAATGHGIAIWLTVPVTLFDHGQGDAAVADAQARVGRARVAREEQEVVRTERALAARFDRLARARVEAEASAREAERVATAARSLYQSGESTVTDVFDALEDAELAQDAHLDVLAAIAEARIAWMQARGTSIDPRITRACIEASRKDGS